MSCSDLGFDGVCTSASVMCDISDLGIFWTIDAKLIWDLK